jgi:predicted RNA-binding protein with PUA-like domain
MKKYWLFKSEPEEYSIIDLAQSKTGRWDGIRNYQARNFIKTMNEGDYVYFYHSSCSTPGIYGLMEIMGAYYPDPTAFDPTSPYYAQGHRSPKDPWLSIDVKFKEQFNVPLTLQEIKKLPLTQCPLIKQGNRLSIIPLSQEQFYLIADALSLVNKV